MAAGLPCIVTDWAANADQIEDGKGGVVIKGDIVDGTIEAINKIKSAKLRKMQSDFNRLKIKSYYSEPIIIKLYIEVYESLIKKNE